MSSIHEYLPETLKDVIDLKLLNEDLDIELEQLDGYITGIGKEVIVKSASLYGIEKWEKALGITPKDGDSLETRRFRVNNLLTSKLPYTFRWLIKKLTQITGSPSGYTLNINQDDYAITIVLSGLDTNMMIAVQKQLRNAIPSNMVLEIGGPPLVSADIKVGTALRIGTKYKIKSAKTGLPGGKNLFDISKIITNWNTSLNTGLRNNNDGTLTVTNPSSSSTSLGLAPNTLKDYCPSLQVGDEVYLNATTTGTYKYIYLDVSKKAWNFDTKRTITQNDLDSKVFWYASGVNTTATISNIMISKNGGEYEPFIEL